MIKRIRNSLTVKICILLTFLLIIVSGITYGMISRFLPTYYSNHLEEDLADLCEEMVDVIGSYKTIEDAFYAIELFEAGSQVSVVILDGEGNPVYPQEEAADAVVAYYSGEEANQEEYVLEYSINEALPDEVEEEAFFIIRNDNAEGYTVEFEEENQEIYLEVINNSAVKNYKFEIGEHSYTMVVSGGMQPVDQAMGILREIFPSILGCVVLVAVVFSMAASFYLTIPIVRLSRTSKRMASLDFTDRYEGKRRDEIGLLGNDLNELSANLSCALTKLQSANQKLKSDIEKERELEQKRIAFFSAVSHELKTPITILKGHLSGMINGVGEYRNRDYYLSRSKETVDKMEDMVGELLTVSRIETRKFITEKVNMAEVIRQQLADMTELMEEKNLELVVDMPERLCAEVNTGMMEHVFRNLLMNAIRYTPENAGNQIRVTLNTTSEGKGKFCCSVVNTGVFIPEEALPHLFEAFYRVEQSRNRQTGGSGLGLYIVKMILEQHGIMYTIRNGAEGVEFCFKN